jgi:hypothetical protein
VVRIALRKGLLAIARGTGSEDFYQCVDFNECIGLLVKAERWSLVRKADFHVSTSGLATFGNWQTAIGK